MTAVEWFAMITSELGYVSKEQLQQAKEMEKQQIIDAVEWNYKSNMGEVYYNATFNKKTL